MSSTEADKKNPLFWNELCGTHFFKSLGLKEVNKESLDIFDKAYFDYYPYLKSYLNIQNLERKDVLEIGLGFGTVSEYLAINSKNYIGLDYSKGPVEIVNERIKTNGKQDFAHSIQGDARDLPFENEKFDFVVSIGCLHHTGDTPKCIEEIYRVLKPNGVCLIMLYNKNSFRRGVLVPLKYFLKKEKKYTSYKEYERAKYDTNLNEEAAPHTDYFSKNDVKKMFSKFNKLKINSENFDDISRLSRTLFLSNIAKFCGIDLYIKATK